MWFQPEKVLSHNALLNFVLSERGAGKTYSSLKFAIEQYDKKGHRFIYCRRNDKTLNTIKNDIFNELNRDLRRKIVVYGGQILDKTEKDQEPKLLGWVQALSLAAQYKSASYDKARYYIYDEFIDEDQRYLTREPERLLSLFETVFRMRKGQLLALANSYTYYNPYFTYFGIPPLESKQFFKTKQGLVLAHALDATQYRDAKANTAFAKLIEGTEYGKFILGNDAVADDYSGVTGAEKGYAQFSFVFEGKDYSLLQKPKEGYHVIEGKVPDVPFFSLEMFYKPNMINKFSNNPALLTLKNAGFRGDLTFKTMGAKLAVRKILYNF